jgi:excisionase family DNA binding protein
LKQSSGNVRLIPSDEKLIRKGKHSPMPTASEVARNREERRHPDRLLSPLELASYLSVPLSTIYRFNYVHSGPKPLKVGKHVRYRESDVETWLDDQARDS